MKKTIIGFFLLAITSFVNPVYAVNFSDLIQINPDTTTNIDTATNPDISSSSIESETTESNDTATVESETTQESSGERSEGGGVSQNTVMIAAIIIVFMFLVMLV